MERLKHKLEAFTSENSIRTKGSLCVVLVLTRAVHHHSAPFDPERFLTAQGGQVAGLGGSAVQSILEDHGISRVLAEEGGRTSRGSIKVMRSYLAFLNELESEELLDLREIENWWIERVRLFFASKPLRLKVDASKSLRSILADLIEAAYVRQRESHGTMVAGAILQHLVGAKLELVLPGFKVEHHGFSVADAPGARKGDFLVGDTAIHVTTAPSEALLRKCRSNLENNLRPLIITTHEGAGGAFAAAKNLDLVDRVEILEIEQFVATNVLEWSAFQLDRRPISVSELIKIYNRIVEECESDPSLRITLG